ncbi:MAG: hypothetical protein HQL77_04655 [Magnetococcales bacterium]|nr:hypothetical protein [Magnetococcales bacterium]
MEKMFAVTPHEESGKFGSARGVFNERRNILLVLFALEPTPGVVRTALSMMERLDAGVEILLRTETQPYPLALSRFLDDVTKSGKRSHLIFLPELSWEAVVHHARTVSDIVCILVESLENFGLINDPESRRPPAWSKHLPCPLVVAGSSET